MKVIICDKDEVVNQILSIAPACLKLIVATDYSNPILSKSRKIISTQIKTATLERAEKMGINLVKFGDVERFGMFGQGASDIVLDDRINRRIVKVRTS